MFLVPLHQGPSCFSNILLSTVYGWTLVAVDNTTLLVFWVLIFGLDQYVLEGPVTFEMCPYAMFKACVPDASPQALYTWDENVSHTGSSPRGSSCLIVVAESIAVLLLTWVLPISSSLPLLLCFVPCLWPTYDTYTLPELPWGAVTPHLKALWWCKQTWPCGEVYLWHCT